MTHITGWTNRTTPHRRGKPVGAESSGHGSHSSVQEEENKDDDTFIALFYDKKQAEAFKAGQNVDDVRTHPTSPETVEWSVEESQAARDGRVKKRDEHGNLLTHKGNVIKRGFNPGQQQKQRIVCTNDPELLNHTTLQKRFDESKHKMSSYIATMGPPRKKRPDLSKQQWRRIQRAGFDYENLEEKKRPRRTTDRSGRKGRSKTLALQRQGSALQQSPNQQHELGNKAKIQLPGKEMLGGREPKQIIEGNLFQFDNPDRYKTDQLREQALALLVPGYLQYVYDIN